MPRTATKRVEPAPAAPAAVAPSVFSGIRSVQSPRIAMPRGLRLNTRLKMDGLKLLAKLPAESIPVAFFDPQYRGILDKMAYGNEGQSRSQRRCALQQMSEATIAEFIKRIDAALLPSGHLFLWLDKFHLCNGFRAWLDGTKLDVVDLINWNKGRIGMGYRSRRTTEYCIVLQKQPRKAKGVWKIHTIPDTWLEKADNGNRGNGHPHKKPVALQAELIAAVSNAGDTVLDPAAGDFTVLEAAKRRGRNFIGCDLNQ
ncbi:MAG: DNA methyltransferase [Gammaproteobacteria bacterium]|nr:DNA methyltransferase [Gammaproteobacteria bacterium]